MSPLRGRQSGLYRLLVLMAFYLLATCRNMKHRRAKLPLIGCTFGSLFLLLLANATDAAIAAESPPREPNEFVGLELSPVWAGHSVGKVEQRNGSEGSVFVVHTGLSGVMRFGRVNRPRFYWAPLEVGLAVSSDGLPEMVMAASEFGLRLPLGKRVLLEVGSAIGIGVLGLGYINSCDGTCQVGGGRALVSPVVRVTAKSLDRLAFGMVARAFVPLGTLEEGGFYFPGYAVAASLGIEVTLR